jgi:hypothetical protein
MRKANAGVLATTAVRQMAREAIEMMAVFLKVEAIFVSRVPSRRPKPPRI